jgi:hypothetical protein
MRFLFHETVAWAWSSAPMVAAWSRCTKALTASRDTDCGDSWHGALAMTDAVLGKTSKSS